eukprot:6850307-Prymnesium_polylepis.1
MRALQVCCLRVLLARTPGRRRGWPAASTECGRFCAHQVTRPAFRAAHGLAVAATAAAAAATAAATATATSTSQASTAIGSSAGSFIPAATQSATVNRLGTCIQ